MMKSTKRERLAAALIAECDPKTVDRHIEGKLPVRGETEAILDYVLDPPVITGASPVQLLLERADELGRIARERTGKARR